MAGAKSNKRISADARNASLAASSVGDASTVATARASLDTRALAIQNVGSQIDRYQGIAEGNADLFNVRLDGPAECSDERPVIYSGAQGNPDLSF